ncbi:MULTISPECIES: hypothetical protein [unclassified Streptomyces]|uniref:hypothetical protein n=1 Tax=unclassified Streptomyces TaxID=2593676 RepID=UPI001F45A242|nr:MULTISPECIES: hypothetical protein [unclassified Streptomyces]MCF0086595.1 hypothetical protein [Streptomyces sp. MH192]MCF0098749.1 hypothetical protein [Streptomyces sp. MH191]
MALNTTPFVVTDGEHTAQQFRMMIKDLAQGNQGVTQGSYLKVSALSTPGAGVQIGDGSAVITGVYAPNQGSYNVYNIGTDTVSISAAGGTGRSDMIVLRVQDPEYEGSRDPSNAAFFDVISNVSSTATTVPSGYSAIPLARIDIPSSTATITNAMIKDLRKVANPRRERVLYPYYAASDLVEISGTSETWKTFPNLTMQNIPIPSWAASVKVVFTICGLRLADGNIWGNFRFMLGTIEAAQYVGIDDNQGNAARRNTVQMIETIDLTTTTGAAMRGTTQPFYSRMRTRSSNAGKIGVDGTTTFNIDVEFTEGAL